MDEEKEEEGDNKKRKGRRINMGGDGKEGRNKEKKGCR